MVVRRRPRPGLCHGIVRPDGYGRWVEHTPQDPREVEWLFEHDRGTETIDTLLGKIDKYTRLMTEYPRIGLPVLGSSGHSRGVVVVCTEVDESVASIGGADDPPHRPGGVVPGCPQTVGVGSGHDHVSAPGAGCAAVEAPVKVGLPDGVGHLDEPIHQRLPPTGWPCRTPAVIGHRRPNAARYECHRRFRLGDRAGQGRQHSQRQGQRHSRGRASGCGAVPCGRRCTTLRRSRRWPRSSPRCARTRWCSSTPRRDVAPAVRRVYRCPGRALCRLCRADRCPRTRRTRCGRAGVVARDGAGGSDAGRAGVVGRFRRPEHRARRGRARGSAGANLVCG